MDDRLKALCRLVPCPCACRTGRGTTGGGLERSLGQDIAIDAKDGLPIIADERKIKIF